MIKQGKEYPGMEQHGLLGENLYRVVIEKIGRVSFISEIKTIMYKNNDQVRACPNLENKGFSLNSTTEIYSVSILNMSGYLLKSYTFNELKNVNIDFSAYTPGIYYLLVELNARIRPA